MPRAPAVSLLSPPGRCAGNEPTPQPFCESRDPGAEHAQSLRHGARQLRSGAEFRNVSLAGAALPASLDCGVFSLRRADRSSLQCGRTLVPLSESQRRSHSGGPGPSGTDQRRVLRPLFRRRRSRLSGRAEREPHGGSPFRVFHSGGLCLDGTLLRQLPGVSGGAGDRSAFCALHCRQRVAEGSAGSGFSSLSDRTSAGRRRIPFRGRRGEVAVFRSASLPAGSERAAPSLQPRQLRAHRAGHQPLPAF